MSDLEILERLRLLPEEKQAEVFDFIDYLLSRLRRADKAPWTNSDFAEFAFRRALRGMEDDPVTYDRDDIRYPWR